MKNKLFFMMFILLIILGACSNLNDRYEVVDSPPTYELGGK